MEKVRSNGCGRSDICSLEVGEMAGNSEYRNKWISEKLDRVNLTMPKGQKETIKAHAEAQGESLNAFINRAITETMERDGAATEEAKA